MFYTCNETIDCVSSALIGMHGLNFIVEHEIKMQTCYELRHPQVRVHAYIGILLDE